MTVEEDIASESTFDAIWNLNLTVPLYLAVLLFPLICFKSATFFTKFNALGIEARKERDGFDLANGFLIVGFVD